MPFLTFSTVGSTPLYLTALTVSLSEPMEIYPSLATFPATSVMTMFVPLAICIPDVNFVRSMSLFPSASVIFSSKASRVPLPSSRLTGSEIPPIGVP